MWLHFPPLDLAAVATFSYNWQRAFTDSFLAIWSNICLSDDLSDLRNVLQEQDRDETALRLQDNQEVNTYRD